jgi:TolB protein
LTHNRTATDSSPSVSPNGRKVAFASINDTINEEIYIMEADGTPMRRVTKNTDRDLYPTFSPDGRKLLFTSTRRHVSPPGSGGSHAHELFRMNRHGAHVRLLSKKDVADRAVWSPTKNKIVFAAAARSHSTGGGTQLWTMRPDGTDEHQLTSRKRFGVNRFPDFSPNGRRIVFSRQRDLDHKLHVWVMRADGTHERRLTKAPRDDYGPVFSPNGKRIAFAGLPREHFNLMVMRSDGSHQHKLTRGVAPSWGVRP